MSEYRIPSIEELHVGMKYQKFSHLAGRWIDKILTIDDFIVILDEELNDWKDHDIRILNDGQST